MLPFEKIAALTVVLPTVILPADVIVLLNVAEPVMDAVLLNVTEFVTARFCEIVTLELSTVSPATVNVPSVSMLPVEPITTLAVELPIVNEPAGPRSTVFSK